MEGESEEAVRRRIAVEYQNEGLWSSTSSGKDNEQGGGGGADEGDDDDDPLDAFMAGLEVKCVCVCVCVCARVCKLIFGTESSFVFHVHRVRSRSRKMKERQLRRKNSESSTCEGQVESTCCAGWYINFDRAIDISGSAS